MRRIIYPDGRFECELINETSELEYDSSPYCARVTRPNFRLVKTSPCVVRYEGDLDDKMLLQRLTQELKTPFDVANYLVTKEMAEESGERLDYFATLFNKALKQTVEPFDGMQYIETSDSHSLHSYAKYHYIGDVIEQDFPCKLGEPLVYKLNSETLCFELSKQIN